MLHNITLYYNIILWCFVTEHIREIDYLRGFAILAVLIIHTSASFTAVSYLDGVVIANIILDVFTHFAVPLFICISGFVLYMKYTGTYCYCEYYKKRFLRIIPPYLIFTTLYLAYTALGKAYLSGELIVPSALQIVYAYLGAGGYYHLWFFLIIIELYCIYPVLEKLFTAAARRSCEWMVLFGALIVQCAWQIFGMYWKLPLFGYELDVTNKLFFCRIFYFVLGMWVCRHFQEIKSYLAPGKIYAVLVPGVILLTALTSFGWISGIIQFGDYYSIPSTYLLPFTMTLPLCYILSFAVLYGAASHLAQKNTGRFILLAGSFSYGMYLIHPLIMGVLSKLVFSPTGLGPESMLYYLLMFALTLAGSMAAVWIIRKIPGNKYIIG